MLSSSHFNISSVSCLQRRAELASFLQHHNAANASTLIAHLLFEHGDDLKT
jgi:hypothetical protein